MSVPSVLYRSGALQSGEQFNIGHMKVKEWKNRGVFRVSRKFLPVKAAYFFYLGAFVSVLPYLPVFQSYLGLNPLQIGILGVIRPSVSIIAAPFWGSLADKYSLHRPIMLGTMGSSMLLLTSLVFVPSSVNSSDHSFDDYQDFSSNFENVMLFEDEKEIDIHLLKNKTNANYSILSSRSDTTEKNAKGNYEVFEMSSSEKHYSKKEEEIVPRLSEDWKDNYVTFLTFGCVFLVDFFLSSAITPILNSAVLKLVDEDGNAEYGKQRLWGGMGWGTFAAFSGFVIDTYTKLNPSGNVYVPAFVLVGLLGILAIIPAYKIKFLPHTPPESVSASLWFVLRSSHVLMFLLVIFVCGLAVGVITTCQFLFLQELNAPHVLMGLTLTFTCLAEVPFMFFVDKLLQVAGHSVIFGLTLFCYAVRLVGYSLLHQPWWILPIELLHGICYGAFGPASVAYSHLISPPGTSTSFLSVVSAVNQGLGQAVGSILGGLLYHVYGPRTLFRVTAVVCLGMLLIFALFSLLFRRRSPSSYENITDIN